MDNLSLRPIKRFLEQFGNKSGVSYLSQTWFTDESRRQLNLQTDPELTPHDKRWLYNLCRTASEDEYFIHEEKRRKDDYLYDRMWEEQEEQMLKELGKVRGSLWERCFPEERIGRDGVDVSV